MTGMLFLALFVIAGFAVWLSKRRSTSEHHDDEHMHLTGAETDAPRAIPATPPAMQINGAEVEDHSKIQADNAEN